MKKQPISVAIVDDHRMLRTALARFIQSIQDPKYKYGIAFQADNGSDMIQRLPGNTPDILLLDINMPLMDGYETMRWLKKNCPSIRVLALSMFSDGGTITRILRLGALGYLVKNIEPEELQLALRSTIERAFYISAEVSDKIITQLQHDRGDLTGADMLTEKEKEFLTLLCTEQTYKEIAERMKISQRTVDGYRELLFDKLQVRTRVGLVLYAIRNGIVDIDTPLKPQP
jgi:DNA-binding NarL/FixJ family response regulator